MHLINTILTCKIWNKIIIVLLGHNMSSDIKSKGNRSVEAKHIEMYSTTVLIINLSIKNVS